MIEIHEVTGAVVLNPDLTTATANQRKIQKYRTLHYEEYTSLLTNRGAHKRSVAHQFIC